MLTRHEMGREDAGTSGCRRGMYVDEALSSLHNFEL